MHHDAWCCWFVKVKTWSQTARSSRSHTFPSNRNRDGRKTWSNSAKEKRQGLLPWWFEAECNRIKHQESGCDCNAYALHFLIRTVTSMLHATKKKSKAHSLALFSDVGLEGRAETETRSEVWVDCHPNPFLVRLHEFLLMFLLRSRHPLLLIFQPLQLLWSRDWNCLECVKHGDWIAELFHGLRCGFQPFLVYSLGLRLECGFILQNIRPQALHVLKACVDREHVMFFFSVEEFLQ